MNLKNGTRASPFIKWNVKFANRIDSRVRSIMNLRGLCHSIPYTQDEHMSNWCQRFKNSQNPPSPYNRKGTETIAGLVLKWTLSNCFLSEPTKTPKVRTNLVFIVREQGSRRRKFAVRSFRYIIRLLLIWR